VLTCQKAQFSLPDGLHYLNCAYMGPLSRRVQDVGTAAVARKANPAAIRADDFFSEAEEARPLFARLINVADPKRIALIPAASYGIATAAANAPRKDRGNIVISSGQFPSNVYSWHRLAQTHGYTVRTVEPPDSASRGAEWNTRILEAIDLNTAVVALPHVHWTDGTRFDLVRVGERAREADAMFVIDGTQSVGALPFDQQQIGADAIICAGYKWLLAPYSTGCAYFGARFDDGVPLEENWITRAGSENFGQLVDYAEEYQPGAARYDVGEKSNFILLPMLVAALEQVLAWGATGILAYCRSLIRELVAEAPDLGFIIEEDGWRGSHLFGLRAPPGRDLDRVHRMLQEASIFVSRRGSALRISPNIYNDEQDIGALRQVLRDAI
jgi:selenocysteine lyase/cysteine desulfurase